MTQIVYTELLGRLSSDQVQGLFAHWANPPSTETVLRILQGSDHVLLAQDPASGRVLGYITAITDGVSAAYIPHLEVREEMRGQGIGSELTRRMVEKLQALYMVDLVCDPELQPFYERLGFRPYSAMIIRNYSRQRSE